MTCKNRILGTIQPALLIAKVDVASHITHKVPVVLVALGGGNASAATPVITLFGKRYP